MSNHFEWNIKNQNYHTTNSAFMHLREYNCRVTRRGENLRTESKQAVMCMKIMTKMNHNTMWNILSKV